MLEEFLSGLRHLQQAVVFHVLAQVTGNQRLADHRIPRLVFLTHSGAEHFQILVQVGLHFGRLTALNDIYNIIGFEVLLDCENGFNHSTQ